MRTFRFFDFPVYKLSKVLYREVIKLTKRFPREYWELADQMRRCALSICLNIAEGSAKKSDRDFNRYIENALGSVNELAACIDILFEEKRISSSEFSQYLSRAEKIAKQLGGLSKKLKSPK